MWFLVRVAFWLGIASLLLPAAPSQKTAAPSQKTSVSQVGATGGVSKANAWDKPARRTSQDTLLPADLAAPWRGPRPRKATEAKWPA
jgi:hypothetical protein